MAGLSNGIDALAQALFEQEFRTVDEFDSFVTFARANDAVKIHAAPDGSFAAFDGDDELIAEGEGPEDLYRILVAQTPAAPPRSQAARP